MDDELQERTSSAEAVRVEAASVRYSGRVTGLETVDLALHAGERLAVVGESGAGKTTLLRLIAGLVRPSAGRVLVRDDEGWLEPWQLSGPAELAFRARLQLAWQDARDALDPAMSARQAVAQGYGLGAKPVAFRPARLEAADRLLLSLGVYSGRLAAPPARLSGGECRRVVLARALAALGFRASLDGQPAAPPPTPTGWLLLDEPTAALDPEARARVLELLDEARIECGLGLVLVTHDLSVAREVSDRIVVMRSGSIIETGTRTEMFDDEGRFLGSAPYCRELAAASDVWEARS